MRITEIIFTWPLGDYTFALECYIAARSFALDHGLCFGRYGDNIAGRIISPSHPEWKTKATDHSVPMELTEDPRWVVTMTLVTDHGPTLEHIRAITLPAGVTRTEINPPGHLVRPEKN